MKRAEADMWWIIAFAVIALVVLVVLISIFARRTDDFNQNVQSCTLRGGSCVESCEIEGQIKNTDCKAPRVCCVVTG